jgi:hypothetical protein
MLRRLQRDSSSPTARAPMDSTSPGYVSALWAEVIAAKIEHPQIAARLIARQTAGMERHHILKISMLHPLIGCGCGCGCKVSSLHPVQWQSSDVTRWLEVEGLADFIQIFADYTGVNLLTLNSTKLIKYELIGLQPPTPTLLLLLADLQQQQQQPAQRI